jgi:hypothetical protein
MRIRKGLTEFAAKIPELFMATVAATESLMNWRRVVRISDTICVIPSEVEESLTVRLPLAAEVDDPGPPSHMSLAPTAWPHLSLGQRLREFY